MTVTTLKTAKSSDATLDWAFPKGLDPLHKPCGSYVLVQMRRQKARVGRIILSGDTRDTNRDNEQVARVVALGPLAYRIRSGAAAMTPWPEGAYCKAGDFVRVPKYGKEAWKVEVLGDEEPVIFNLIRDTDVIARVTKPLDVVNYVG